jgi:hypothetical protein
MLNSTLKLASYNARGRKGDVSRLEEKLDYSYSPSHISNVLAGRRSNTLILNTAYRLASRRQTNKSKFVA